MNALFHLAFPVHDFALAKQFYHQQLGFALGRESASALIFQFGPHQIVAHKVDAPLAEQGSIYPRHFGLIFLEKIEFNLFIERINTQKISFAIPLKTRFAHSKIEHQSFFLQDPSNNLLEFKYYTHPSAIFGEKEDNRIGE
ncbi:MULTISPECIES: VOC family protein [Legionella]|uniref:Glyoxalase n=1 Tax=Legionella septentrionalis TaxID=2498109 RepID=A0A433JHV1_9GAMM|nr:MULTISPECIES: VOC family protein [Legionella]MCP0913657.1 VOC family protein [Legionella sp. 27cVA30]RUQ84439.1 glyoxalase [Legionella septentrionalis]RUQ94659.1 glyoxalase [Legionella septentrionalis]RUR09242.1 glyoxalase [Legionella septentrionalis]RUR14490.1 glyoxalase [Legionella septentrionalis]